jgi:hypothetical protein
MIAARRHAELWALVAAVCLAAPTLHADPYSALAFDNATVQPGGPRTGDYGKLYFNIEGANNGAYADYGVADFNSSNLANANGNPMPSTPMVLNSITMTLSQANASFTNAGMLNFYLSENTTTSIQPADNAVTFDATDSEGLNGQLAPLHMLGSGMFTGTDSPTDTSGTLDTFTFPPDNTTQLDSATVAYLLGVLANGGNLRLVITPADPNVAATYAGFSNTIYENMTVTGPTLILDLGF